MTLYITDKAEEFRIEISGEFAASAVTDAAVAWKAALFTNVPRRISVDITRITGYDHAGYLLLRDMHAHGTHIVAGTPRSLRFLRQISSRMSPMPASLLDTDSNEERPVPAGAADFRRNKKVSGERLTVLPPRAAASGK